MSRLRAAPLAALAAALAASFLVACGDAGSSASTAAPPTGTVAVYFAGDAGDLVAEARPVPAGTGPLDAAMGALAEGPASPDLIAALPPGTRVLGAAVEDGVATVDLSADFEAGYPPGGSAAELAAVAPLVRTAAEAAGTGRVRILVEGRAPAPAGGQLDLSEPLSPEDVAAGG